MSDLEGFPRVCAGCNEKVAPTSKKHPRPHWFQTHLETGEKLSYHFEHHPLISGSLSGVRSVKSSKSEAA